MNDPANFQYYSRSFGSDLKNHDYGPQNQMSQNQNKGSRKSSVDQSRQRPSFRNGSPNRVSYSGNIATPPQHSSQNSPKKHQSPTKNPYNFSTGNDKSLQINDQRMSFSKQPTRPNQLHFSQSKHLSGQKESKWLDFIPPMPGGEFSNEAIRAMENRKSSASNSGQQLPDHYRSQQQKLLPPQQFVSSANNSSIKPVSTNTQKAKKLCVKCSTPIAGQFVRAMDMTYHIDCFRCEECDTPCSTKFFPYEKVIDGEKVQVPLCEYDYFKNLDLICYDCNKALRGSYVNAVGHKYHLEHFRCMYADCTKVFKAEDGFYEHDKRIYCHFHYSELFATHCEGCDTPILKQFIEVFKGGRHQQWHPECFMCYRFWSVVITVNCINPPKEQIQNRNIDLSMISRIWSTLSTYEEELVSYVIGMLEYASNGNYIGALENSARLVLKIQYLYNAFDAVANLNIDKVLDDAQKNQKNSDDIYDSNKVKYVPLQNKPMKVTGKLLAFCSYLKSLSSGHHALKGDSKDLISIITNLSTYLKLIINAGLTNVLEYNKIAHSQVATDKFLSEIANHVQVSPRTDPFQIISPLVSVTASDRCTQCDEPISEDCFQLSEIHNNVRWHTSCFSCGNCHTKITPNMVYSATFSYNTNQILCENCTNMTSDNSCEGGLLYVTKLQHSIYIDEISLIRTKFSIEQDNKSDNGGTKRRSGTDPMHSSQLVTNIKRMKSSRQNGHHNKSASSIARKSTILNAPAGKSAQMENSDDPFEGKRSLQVYDRTEIQIQDDELIGASNPPALISSLKGGRLTLGDIHRIVTAEQAKQLLPNAYKHTRDTPAMGEDNIADMLKRTGTVANLPDAGGKRKQKVGKYFSELSAEEHFIIRHISIFALERIIGKSYNIEKLLELIPTRKQQTFWARIKGSGGKKTYKGPKVFGAPLEELTQKYGAESEKAVGPRSVTIPSFVEDCLEALLLKDMSVEGIFRKNGNIRRLRELTETINEHPDKLPDFSNENQIQLSALLKKFLREMPDPLFTFKLYDVWIESRKYPTQVIRNRILKLVVAMLPKCNRDLLEVLFSFFNWVASFAHIDQNTGSKMNSHNLATVLAPNILYQKPDETANPDKNIPALPDNILKANTEAGDGYLLSIEVLNVFISNHAEFATVPSDIMNVYNTLLKDDPTVAGSGENNGKNALSSKEIINKIQSVLENHPGILKDDADSNFGDGEYDEGDSTITPTVIKNMDQLEVGKNTVIE